MTTAKTLYQDLILEHGRAPRNEGPLPSVTHEATTKNPLCGDRVTLRLEVKNDVVTEARFEARGCMIARASASLLTEAVRGRNVADALAIAADMTAFHDPLPLPALEGAREFPARRACVTLPWKALTSALHPDDVA